ncbi:BZ3500_MvSof-1268-A1-R1_Chr12-2g03910 [Microbotryum saponariae]|uniref:BZ3500_MvSof-1268-A1-R1_Chr12-2g03910 protein n=1 Tax=Microbotryum saponariae TaxID=289078 RepID=A0A2X0MPV4_9BASI|nr:BZ3500_MvSof-1268-A1-R1_Chr12-2g03910 [Microbotryum saponariae]
MAPPSGARKRWPARKPPLGNVGGGLIATPLPAPTPPTRSNQEAPLFLSDADDDDDDDDSDEMDMVAGPSPSTTVELNGQISRPSVSATTLAQRRLREASLDSNALDLEDDDPDRASSASALPPPPPKRPKTTKATTAKTKQAKGNQKESQFIPSVEFPPHFVKLEKTFKALNTVYTFVQTRKSLATTFDILKGSVESLIKRPLEMHDIAQIKSLLPQLVTFAYIDAEMLRIHSTSANPSGHDGAEDDARSRRMKKARELDEAYAEAAAQVQEVGGSHNKKESAVLMFSFNDGELKSSNGVGKVITRKWQRKKQEKHPQEMQRQNSADGKTPVRSSSSDKVPQYSKESMTSLIERRNAKFSAAVSELLVACAAAVPPEDPVTLLLAATDDNLPVKPGDEDEERKGLAEKREDLEFYQRNPDRRPSIEKIVVELMHQKEYRGQIVENGHRIFDARKGVYGDLDLPLSTSVWDALYTTKKITQLYSHQAQAINTLDAGHNVIVSTSTSSGKSLIYQLPALKELEKDHDATAMYIFPTKALAQDQKRALAELLAACGGLEDVKIATFDGDTHREDRDYLRENANIIFTNPDMLHLTILPREQSWRRYFSNLKFVVVDELHYYAGLFGSHVAFIMRRLRRICAAVGNDKVKFISCSATIANPKEHMQTMFGLEDVMVVDVDGSPTGKKEYLIWNPPFIDDQDPKQGRINNMYEASRIFRFLMDRGIRAIVFCKVRAQCELLMRQVRTDLMVEGRSDMASRVMSYRSGYSAADRRRIEQEMFSGQLLGVIATTALELGVDIGSLDAVITVGFPYTLPGLRQQAGRAGRRNKDSLAMLICDPWPLDQHYARNPDQIFTSPFSELGIDLTNPIVFEAHLQCAADEMPVQIEVDTHYFGPELARVARVRLVVDEEGFYHCHPKHKPYPAKAVPIRSTEEDSYTIIDISEGRHEVMEEIETSRAIFTTYEGAIYHHMGRTFLVREVNHDRKIARVELAQVEWRTRQRDFTNIDPLEPLTIREITGSPCTASYGLVEITSIVFGYFKTDKRNNILDTVDISSPPFIRRSHGFWIDVPASALEILLLKNLHPAASIHAAEHALMSLTPIVAMCTEGDVRTECKQPEKEFASMPSSRKRLARLILYDSAGMSGGICAKAFDHISVLIRQAADTIANCRCTEGCPSCVASHMCSGANTIVSKLGALVVLDSILNRPIDIDAIPLQKPAQGIVPGGSIDLAGAGVRRSHINKAHDVQQRGTVEKEGVMEEEEISEAEVRERDRVLAELLGGGPGSETPQVPQTAEVREGTRYDITKGGGFMSR